MSKASEGSDGALWDLVLALRWGLPDNIDLSKATALTVNALRQPVATTTNDPAALLVRGLESIWQVSSAVLPSALRDNANLYLRLLNTTEGWCLAHLGQSLDAQVATANGDSYYVTGEENLAHLHRMRALSDAILVGAKTVRIDNPRLTTRRVAGPSPVRIVIDPNLSVLSNEYGICGDDSKTILVCGEAATRGDLQTPSNVEIVALPATGHRFAAQTLRRKLASLGYRHLFVEGGGVTVSRFVAARAVDYLQVTVAPVIVGAGTAGLSLPAVNSMSEALRAPSSIHVMGADVLFDLDLRND